MNEDKILQMFFDIGRWTKAIEKGVGKDIRKDQLIRLADERTLLAMAGAMRRGKYEISPPHTAQIPKDNGEFRTVYVNEPMDRVVLGIANDLLFELMPEMLHPSCKSYQTGIGCGKVVAAAGCQKPPGAAVRAGSPTFPNTSTVFRYGSSTRRSTRWRPDTDSPP